MADQDLSDEIFKRAKDPQWWLRQAECLEAAGVTIIEKGDEVFKRAQNEPNTYKAFDIIAKPEMWMTFVGVMLWGYALENLLKGLLVSKDQKAVWQEKGKLKTKWEGRRGHDLAWLMKQTNSFISDKEKELLNLLTKVTVWGGRYPVPKSIEEVGMQWDNQKQDQVHSLYDRIRRQY